jgi:hypothetical protein
MDEPRQATPTAAINPFLSGNFAPVEAETTCLVERSILVYSVF